MSDARHPILLTGGCGYIGSHIAHLLHDQGHELVVVDNLSNSRRNTIPSDIPFYAVDVTDVDAMTSVMREYGIASVIHMAGVLSVEESVAQPLKYYHNNVGGTQSILQAMKNCGAKKLVFSSTSATYGVGDKPLREDAPTAPVSPYGHSKLMAEQMICDAVQAYGMQAVALRYFNVAGADPQGRTGQIGIKAPHLIGRACQAAAGDAGQMVIYGDDYNTPDGTCVRDYIHVSDLAAAHEAVLNKTFATPFTVLNCGYGHGYSVKEILSRFEKVTGLKLPIVTGSRRAGDAVWAVADNGALLKSTDWQPRFDDLDVILRTAWDWYQRERVSA